jgi:hypothetical protein
MKQRIKITTWKPLHSTEKRSPRHTHKRHDEMWKDAQGAQKSHTKRKEIELYRRTGTHILGYNCTLPHFSQCAMVKTFDEIENINVNIHTKYQKF